MMVYAQSRKDDLEEKNERMATASLKYREELKDKIDTEQKKHEKNRASHLNKVREAEERKGKYVKERNFVYEDVPFSMNLGPKKTFQAESKLIQRNRR